MDHPELMIAFQGRDWMLLKHYLQQQQATKISMLLSEESHDKSNKIRGSLQVIQQILALEDAAQRAAITRPTSYDNPFGN